MTMECFNDDARPLLLGYCCWLLFTTAVVFRCPFRFLFFSLSLCFEVVNGGRAPPPPPLRIQRSLTESTTAMRRWTLCCVPQSNQLPKAAASASLYRRGNDGYSNESVESVTEYLSFLPARVAPTEQIANTITAFYEPIVYAYSVFDAATILSAARTHSSAFAHDHLGRLLLSPYSLIRQPKCLEWSLGGERQKELERVLLKLLASHEQTHLSLQKQVVLALSEPNPSLVHFLRGLALATAVRMPIAAQGGYVLHALLDDGFVSPDFTLAGELEDRAVALSRVVMTAAREFGSNALLNTALVLTRSAGLEVDYRIARQITACQVMAERRCLDWHFKSCGWRTLAKKNEYGWGFLQDDHSHDRHRGL